MARGGKNQPARGCWPKSLKNKIILYEQGPTHRANSKARPKGFCGGAAGKMWQSHHLLCINSMGNRPKIAGLEDSLYITDWNINDEPNMLGMPQKKKYIQAYGKIERMTGKAAQKTAWATATNKNTTAASGVPKNIPCHNIDHNCAGGYKSDVDTHLKKIWNKFKSKAKDHKKDAAWIEKQLNDASEHFESRLHTFGKRKRGTVKAWQKRMVDQDWGHPFSMMESPQPLKWGKSLGSGLSKIFEKL